MMPAIARGVQVSEVIQTRASVIRGSFLSSGVGARAVGMGEAFTAVADDASAQAWNPGGLGQVRKLGALAMFDAVGEGVGVSCAAVAIPAGAMTLGASITALTFGSYTLRDSDGASLGTASIDDVAGALSMAFPHPAWMGFSGWSGLSL